MSAHATIRSRANPLLKRVGAVLAGKDRERLVLEGDRLVDDALGAGLELELALVAEERAERAAWLAARGAPVRLVEAELLRRAGGLKSSPGVLALCRRPAERPVAELSARGAPLVLVVCGVAEPGNLGALARSAEAFGCGALMHVAGGASPWSSKALRGSMGSLLRLPLFSAHEAAAAALHLERAGFRQRRAEARGGADPRELDWTGATALWVGGETSPLPEIAHALEAVTIPMHGATESLNVAVAASVLLYAAASARSGGAAP
jgi:TrmH family RNA methyltransferase